jgi:hypothetical protein
MRRKARQHGAAPSTFGADGRQQGETVVDARVRVLPDGVGHNLLRA